MPVLGEQIEEDLTPRVRRDDLVVQHHTEAGPGWKREVAVHHFGITRRRAFDEVFGEIVEVLLNLEVGRARRQVEVGRGRDRTADIVGCDQ